MLWKFMHKGVKLLPHWVKSFEVINKAQYYVLKSNLITPNWSCKLLLETKQDKKMKYKKKSWGNASHKKKPMVEPI